MMNEHIELAISPDEYSLLADLSSAENGEKDLNTLIKKKHSFNDNFQYEILRKSIDARRKNNVLIRYQIRVFQQNDYLNNTIDPSKFDESALNPSDKSPIVVGLGPAGLFAALYLAQKGLKPVVIERGCPVLDRIKDIEEYLDGGEIKPYSNVQYGEGGAGTFSDGKLYSGIKDKMKKKVLQILIAHGAPKEILYLAQPHIGSDRLRAVIPSISSEIRRLGGSILYMRTLSDIIVNKGRIEGIMYHHSADPSDEVFLPCDELIIAPGHSARDTFSMLYKKGVLLESKPFAVGVRIEHRQDWIDQAQYGKWAGHVALPPASYKLAVHPERTRALYSFCMCPGGYVIPSASDRDQVVTNGMSLYDRGAQNANAALLIPVDTNDFPDAGPLSGMIYQKELEKKAFEMGGRNGFAPCQKLGDFFAGRSSTKHGEVIPSYLPGVTYSNLHHLFPDYIAEALLDGIIEMGKRIKCFSHPDALLTAVETRSSSPVRIIRDHTGQSVSIEGLFPCGEGSGYSGGIMSSAIDGLRIAEFVWKKLKS